MRHAAIVGALTGAAIGTAAALWSCTVDRKTDALACSSQSQCTPMGRVCEQGYCVVDPNFKLDAAIDAYIPDAPQCPTICTGGCNFSQSPGTCMINGGGGAPVTCPSGYHCIVMCPTTGACGTVTCDGAATCAVTCGADQACGDVACGSGSCNVACVTSGSVGSACGNITGGTGDVSATCTGSGACGTITCSNGGACSANCSGGTMACGAMTCGPGKCTETCTGTGACGNLSCATSCNCNATCSVAGACATMTCPMHTKYCAVGEIPGNPCDSGVFNQCKTCP